MADVHAGDRCGGGERQTHQAPVHGQHEPPVRLGVHADGDLHGERPGVLHGQRDRRQGRSGDLTGPLGDQAEDLGA